MFSSVAQSCLSLCEPMNRSMPGLPVHHQLPESTQTHVHWVSDAIQPSHPLSSPFSSCLQSFPASGSFPMSQFSASGGQSIGSFSFNMSPSNEHPGLNSFRMDWISLQSKGLSRLFSELLGKPNKALEQASSSMRSLACVRMVRQRSCMQSWLSLMGERGC